MKRLQYKAWMTTIAIAAAGSSASCPSPADTGAIATACWDLNGNGLPDAAEDVNGDGVVDVYDCRGSTGPAGAAGAAGADGQDGEDAPERLYGDGSSGSRTVTGTARFETADDANQLWTDFTVAAGATLRVQSGAIIRCTGTFTNNGTIIVEDGAQGGDRSSLDGSTLEPAGRPAALGINTLAASGGETGDASAARAGGFGGDGISEFEALVTLRVSVRAGSGGGAALSGSGAGGGSLTVFANGPIQNSGSIVADGVDASDDGGGGGGGGILILASAVSISNTSSGILSVDGGAGGDAGAAAAAGGGGGGGIVHLIAPSINNLGTTSTGGGSAGSTPAGLTVTAVLRSGGGGGGGSGGAGGQGGLVPADAPAVPGAASGGSSGRALTTYRRPELLFR